MWLKNLVLYRLPADWSVDADALEQKLAQQPLQPCGGFQMESSGWVCPRDDGRFLYQQQRQWRARTGGVHIITGRGKGSVRNIAVVKRAVHAMLSRPPYSALKVSQGKGNPGRLTITAASLHEWLQL